MWMHRGSQMMKREMTVTVKRVEMFWRKTLRKPQLFSVLFRYQCWWCNWQVAKPAESCIASSVIMTLFSLYTYNMGYFWHHITFQVCMQWATYPPEPQTLVSVKCSNWLVKHYIPFTFRWTQLEDRQGFPLMFFVIVFLLVTKQENLSHIVDEISV